jgi:S-DNA-T family DNA segregation ATPase FtsK/SpoIIIE
MAHRTISATKLEFAVLDPDWRAKWLAGEKPSTRSFAPPGTPRALGSRFHKEAETLIGWLTGRESLVAAARIDSAAALLDRLWASSLQAYTDELFAQRRGEEAALYVAHARLLRGILSLSWQFCISANRARTRSGRRPPALCP